MSLTKTVQTIIVGALLNLTVFSGARAAAPPDAPQVLFLLDNSSSMTEPGGDPARPGTRWDLVTQVLPEWNSHLMPGTLAGAVTVGGDCGVPPTIKLPVGTSSDQIAAAVASTSPNGSTNLNSVLASAPSLFPPGIAGPKTVVLLTDGADTCNPVPSTCEIAKGLYRDHGITVDVVALVATPEFTKSMACVAEVTHGQLSVPTSFNAMVAVPMPALFDPWPYIVTLLSAVTLLAAGRVLYRHAHRVLGWRPRTASVAAGTAVVFGATAVYVAIFIGSGLVAGLIGASCLSGALAIAARRPKAREITGPGIGAIGLLVGALLTPEGASAAAPSAAPVCAKLVSDGQLVHDHVIVLDVSGSVTKALPAMKAFVSCYASTYVRTGESVSVILFATDGRGSVVPKKQFDAPTTGAGPEIEKVLDDVSIQDPTNTTTYFQPLAVFLNDYLKQHVRRNPVVVVVSDGRSDANGSEPFAEVPFEAFGGRGVYSVPGARGWKVAVDGGQDLDLAQVFTKPVKPRAPSRGTMAIGPAIDPCVLDPQPVIASEPVVHMAPGILDPGTASGTVSVTLRTACDVIRNFDVEITMRRGTEVDVLGRVTGILGAASVTRTFDVDGPAGAGSDQATLEAVVVDAAGLRRTVTSSPPAQIEVVTASYASTWGLPWGIALVLSIASISAGYRLRGNRRQAERDKPLLVEVDGSTMPIAPGRTVWLGGKGSELVVMGVGEGARLASVSYEGEPGVVFVEPAPGVLMTIDGLDSIGRSRVPLGRALGFQARDNKRHEVAIRHGKASGISFGIDPVEPDLNASPGGGFRASNSSVI